MITNQTILVVDDDANNRETVAQILLEYAPEVRLLSAIHGKQALEILQKRHIDLLLLDWEMPVMDGMQTLAELKKSEQWQAIPVIMYTGIMTQSSHLKTALEQGAVDFLRKPADPIELIARVQSVLAQKQFQQTILEMERKEAEEKQKRIQRENELLRKELQNYLILLAQKNEILSDIKNRCETSLQKQPDKKMTEISRHIEHLLEQEHYWEDFLHKFNQSDKDFIQRLSMRYPDLSPAEIRYCALLRCGMDNKSIAHLLNISMESAMTTRYRIRKKIGMEGDESLDKIVFSI